MKRIEDDLEYWQSYGVVIGKTTLHNLRAAMYRWCQYSHRGSHEPCYVESTPDGIVIHPGTKLSRKEF